MGAGKNPWETPPLLRLRECHPHKCRSYHWYVVYMVMSMPNTLITSASWTSASIKVGTHATESASVCLARFAMQSLVFCCLLTVCALFCSPAACQETSLNYRLGVQRADNDATDLLIDLVTLECLNYSTRAAINLRQNENIKFWLDRRHPGDADLRSRFPTVRPTVDRMGITFQLRDVGEGNFSCGVQLNDANVDESTPVTLIGKRCGYLWLPHTV